MSCGELGKGAKTEHTPEPWAIFDGDPRAIVTVANPMLSLLSVDDEGMAIMFEQSDARRIVACVNACAGISTEALESEGSAVMGWNRTTSKLIRATKQRDELLAALEYCRSVFDEYIGIHLDKTPPDYDKAARNENHRSACDAAIASVKDES